MEQGASSKKESKTHIKIECPQMTDLYDEIEKVKKQIDDLLLTTPDLNDPQVKASVKKMKQIKKFLSKKTAHGSHTFLSMRRKKKQDIKNAINTILQDNNDHNNDDLMSTTSSELIETLETFREKSNIVSVDIDDSIIHGIDCLIHLWNEIKRHIQ